MTQTKKMSYKTGNFPLFSLKMRHFGYKSPENRVKNPPAVTIHRGNFFPKKFTVKERDSETGLYYYGARYLDSKTSRWLSGDPAMGEYVPEAPVSDEARKRNGNLPGMGGVFNYVNLHVYHYAGNNPVKYVDPDGEKIVVKGNLLFKIKTWIAIFRIGAALRHSKGTDAYQDFRSLKSDKNYTLTIEQTTGGNQFSASKDTSGKSGTVGFNETKTTGGTDKSGSNERPPFIGLGHEIGHGIDNRNGTFIDNTRKPAGDPSRFPNKAEEKAVEFENTIRDGYWRGDADKQRPSY